LSLLLRVDFIGKRHGSFNVLLEQDSKLAPESRQVRARRVPQDPAFEHDQIGRVADLGQVAIGLNWDAHSSP
jgi:hypothetical protein